jgi:hypothetical protein
MPVDEQQRCAIDRGEVEGRRPALEGAAVRHQETALASAPLDEHHRDRGARVARAQHAPRIHARGAQRAAHETPVGVLAVQGEQLGAASEQRGLRERRPDHPAALHHSLAVAKPRLTHAQVLDHVEVVDHAETEPHDPAIARAHPGGSLTGRPGDPLGSPRPDVHGTGDTPPPARPPPPDRLDGSRGPSRTETRP